MPKEKILQTLNYIEWLLAVNSIQSLKDIELQIKILKNLLNEKG